MAANQTHLNIRYDLTKRIALMQSEKAALATSATRYTALGTPSTGDGGATSTGEFLDAVEALQELLSNAAGDPNFGAVNPAIASIVPATGTAAAPTDLGPGNSTLRIAVRNLLPAPSVVLRPTGAADGSTDIDLTSFISSIVWSQALDSISGMTVPIGTITVEDVTAALIASGSYTLQVSNPLDTGAAVATLASVFLVSTAT